MPGITKFPAPALKAETLRSDGKIYAVPFASQTMLIVYNTELFAKHGVKVPETWDELLDASKKLKAAGVIPFGNGTATAWQNETIVGALLSSMLGKQFEADILTGKADFTDKRFVDALASCRRWPRTISRRAIEGIDYASSQQLFSSGAAAMFAGGSFEVAPFLKANPALKLDVFASPVAKKGDERLVGDVPRWRLCRERQVRQQGGRPQVHATSCARKDFGDKFANTLSNLSPIPGVTFKDPTLAKVAELNKTSMSYLMLVHFRYQEPSGSVLLQSAVQKMLAGKQTPAEAGAEITKGIATYYAPFKK